PLKIVATALQRYGRKRLAEVIQPAIELAENGFPVNFVRAGDATSSRTSFYAETAAVFRPGGVPLQQGQILKQPDLAKTLRLIAAKGPDVLYRGEIGAAIVAAQRATANGGKPGLMTMQDLADYNIVIRQPIVAEYRGYRIAAMSPPSSGGLTMIQALKMIERYPLGYGFMLNNELTDFIFGFNMHPRFGGPGANDVQGGKRPRSSMTPTILFKGREPVAAFGSPGGATIISSVYNVLINLVDHGMTIQQAVEAPRISVTTADNAIA